MILSVHTVKTSAIQTRHSPQFSFKTKWVDLPKQLLLTYISP